MPHLRKILPAVFLLPHFLAAQNCSVYPNTPDLIQGNHVKKMTTWVADETKNTKWISEILFFDTAGECTKRVYRNPSGYGTHYYISEWSAAENALQSSTSLSMFGKDSSVILLDKDILYHSASGRVVKEEHTTRNDSVYMKEVIIYPDSSGSGRKVFRINSSGDTIEKTLTVNRGFETVTNTLNYIDGKWKETYRLESKTNEHGNLLYEREYHNGQLTLGDRWEYTYDEHGQLTASQQTDSLHHEVRKTRYFDHGSATTVYIDGKQVNAYEEHMPYSDPMPENWLPATDSSAVKKNAPVIVKTVRGTPHYKPRTVKFYRDPVKKDELIMTQYFGTNGLIQKQEEQANRKIYSWEYEFYP